MFWTTLEVKDKGKYVGGISLPTESKRRRYGAAEKDFDGLNRFMAAQWDWNKINAEKRNIEDYLDSLRCLPRSFVILLDKTESVVDLFGKLLRNCLIVDGGRVSGGNDSHTYFLPLHFHAALTAWLRDTRGINYVWPQSDDLSVRTSFQQQDVENEDLAITFKGHQAYVQGIKWDRQEADCLACPYMLERALYMCHPMYVDCKKSEPPFTVLPKLDEETGENSFKELKQWYLDNPMDIAALQCPEVESICKYAEAKKLSSRGAFECVSLRSLTSDEHTLKQLHDERSERSSCAARTAKMKRTICDGCLQADMYGCQRRCDGPWYGADYLHLAENCKPWMVWALELSLYGRTFDFRKVIPELRRNFIEDHTLVPRIGGKMLVIKATARETSNYDASFSLVHSVISAQNDIKFPADDHGAFYETWEGLEKSVCNLKRYAYWPLPEWVKALAYVLTTCRQAHQMHVRCGFCSNDFMLSNIELRSTSILLYYSKGSRSHSYRKIESLDDLYQFRVNKVHTDARREENKFLHKLALEDNVLIPGRCFRHVVETRNWRELSIKDWKKLLKAARIEGEKKAYGRVHSTDLLLEAFKEQDARPSD